MTETQANGVGHVGVGDIDDRLCCRRRTESQWLCNMFDDRAFCPRWIKTQVTAREPRAEPSKHDVGIGISGQLATLAVARRPWPGLPLIAGRYAAIRRHQSTQSSRPRHQ